jgi:hypothetical protein
MLTKLFTKYIPIAIIMIIAVAGFTYLYAAQNWTGPTTPPPPTGTNVDAPINVGANIQTKGFTNPNNDPVSLYVFGNINASACFGPTFNKASANSSNASMGGYVGASAMCGVGYHICSVTEIMNSNNCGVNYSNPPGGGGSVIGTFLWVAAGTPLPVDPPLNDCFGFTKTTDPINYPNGIRGVQWSFSANGGAGFVVPCTASTQVACCR